MAGAGLAKGWHTLRRLAVSSQADPTPAMSPFFARHESSGECNYCTGGTSPLFSSVQRLGPMPVHLRGQPRVRGREGRAWFQGAAKRRRRNLKLNGRNSICWIGCALHSTHFRRRSMLPTCRGHLGVSDLRRTDSGGGYSSRFSNSEICPGWKFGKGSSRFSRQRLTVATASRFFSSSRPESRVR